MKKVRVLLLEIDESIINMLRRYFKGDLIELVVFNSVIIAQEELNSAERSEDHKFDLIFFDSRIVEDRECVDAATNKILFGERFFVSANSELTKKRFVGSGYQSCTKEEIFGVIRSKRVMA